MFHVDLLPKILDMAVNSLQDYYNISLTCKVWNKTLLKATSTKRKLQLLLKINNPSEILETIYIVNYRYCDGQHLLIGKPPTCNSWITPVVSKDKWLYLYERVPADLKREILYRYPLFISWTVNLEIPELNCKLLVRQCIQYHGRYTYKKTWPYMVTPLVRKLIGKDHRIIPKIQYRSFPQKRIVLPSLVLNNVFFQQEYDLIHTVNFDTNWLFCLDLPENVDQIIVQSISINRI